MHPTACLTTDIARLEVHEFRSTDFALARLTFGCVIATGSFQIGGSANVDGRGKFIWDDFSQQPGKTMDGISSSDTLPHAYAHDIESSSTSSGAPTEEPAHVSGTRCVSTLLFRCWGADQVALKFAIHLCANSTLLRIVGWFHDGIFSDLNSPTGLNKGINFLQVTLEYDRRHTNYFEEGTRRFNEESDTGDPGSVFRCTLLPFSVSYSRLVMYSFGFQHAFNEAWRRVTMSSLTRPLVFAPFASAFMLKLLRPEFVQLLTRQIEVEIFELIGRLITTFQDGAIDERHTPRLMVHIETLSP
ncbi:hypothetical protein EDD22DRAFT_950661 [Suillus occidentalis]|nr:hypothetical protein EDD22DRAFT_950661 [Suillus occidentalis]